MTPADGGSRAYRPLSVAPLVVGSLGTNCYVLRGGSGRTAPATLIDPGGDAPRIINHVEGLGLEVRTVLLTHGHSDHLEALPGILARWPAAQVGISAKDRPMLGDRALNLSAFVGTPVEVRPQAVNLLSGGDLLELDGLSIEVIPSPGHTPGGLCYFHPSPRQPVLFSGDTLFAGSVGRTDLPGGSAGDLLASLKRLAQLPPETLVYPGHGEATSIRAELRTNPYLIRLRAT